MTDGTGRCTTRIDMYEVLRRRLLFLQATGPVSSTTLSLFAALGWGTLQPTSMAGIHRWATGLATETLENWSRG